ncbi:MAG: cytochrome b N-terminal domain-containing protein, partial [Candidatus Margulisiibacteriota bacterium]
MSEKDNNSKENNLEKRSGFRDLLDIFSLMGFAYGELDRRLDMREALEKLLKKPVPKHVNWLFCFGGITFLCFVIQVVTGILLLFYYKPTPAEAYSSVVHITNGVPFGWLIRSVHAWASNLMITFVFLHMIRVFVYKAYKEPRDFNWVIGVTLLCLTLGFGFTGYLLPWNQLSYWATTVGTEIPGAVPVIGPHIKLILR